MLDKALQAAGIEPEGVFVTNAVKHFRFSGTKGKRRIHASPGRVHIAACQPWLLAELDLVTPQGVVLLGAAAAKSILGSSFKITEGRGQVLAWPGEFPLEHTPQWALATTHPSAVLRSTDRDAAFEALVSDLKVAGSARS
ncbi:MAG: uracil-DNA glycosylase family protein [Nocardioidaceae bacterium]